MGTNEFVIAQDDWIPLVAKDTTAMTHVANRKRGFTLIELLVVISIIVLLITLLLPAIEGARRGPGRGLRQQPASDSRWPAHVGSGQRREVSSGEWLQQHQQLPLLARQWRFV